MLAVAVAGLDGINTSPKTSQCPNSLPGPTAAKHCAGPQHVTNKGPGDLGKGPPKGCGFAYLTLLLGFPGCSKYGNTHGSRLFWDNDCRWLCCMVTSTALLLAPKASSYMVRVFRDPILSSSFLFAGACAPSFTWELLISNDRLRNPTAVSPRWLIITWVENSGVKGKAVPHWVRLVCASCPAAPEFAAWAKVLGLDAGWDIHCCTGPWDALKGKG